MVGDNSSRRATLVRYTEHLPGRFANETGRETAPEISLSVWKSTPAAGAVAGAIL